LVSLCVFNRFALSSRSGDISKEFWKINHESNFTKMRRKKVNAVILHLGAIRIQKTFTPAILRLGVKQLRLGAAS